MKKRLYELLRDLWTDFGLTQQQTAEILDVSAGHYGHFEIGVREPSLSILRRTCELFHVSSDYLLGLSIDEPTEKLFRYSSSLPKTEKNKVFEHNELLYQEYCGKNR